MRNAMKAGIVIGLLALSAVAVNPIAMSQSPGNSSDQSPDQRSDRSSNLSRSAASRGTPLVDILEAVSKRTGKSFILAPSVHGNAVTIGIDTSKITYAELLAILEVNGYAAIESNNLVRIVPGESSRTEPTPLIGTREKKADAEIVTRVIPVKSTPAARLVPLLRPLLPRSAHLAANACTNSLIMVDSYSNVRRIEALVASMDTGEPLTLPRCTVAEPDSPSTAN